MLDQSEVSGLGGLQGLAFEKDPMCLSISHRTTVQRRNRPPTLSERDGMWDRGGKRAGALTGFIRLGEGSQRSTIEELADCPYAQKAEAARLEQRLRRRH